MIQRIQTIFLLLAAIGAFGLFYLPFATSTQAVESSLFFADGDYDIQDHIVMLVLFILAGSLAAITIFLFKNRPLQLKLTRMVIIANILGIIATALIFLNFSNDIGDAQVMDALGIYLPIASLIFAILALRFIKKDEELVRSANRLR